MMPQISNNNSQSKIILLDSKSKTMHTFTYAGQSLSVGNNPENTVQVESMRDQVYFLVPANNSVNIIQQSLTDAKTQTFVLEPNKILELGRWQWMMIPIPQATDSSQAVNMDWQALFNWLREPMQSLGGLKKALREFLELVAKACNASHGILMTNDHDGFTLAECFGVNFQEAVEIWQKMPDNLTAEILRLEARVLLPDGLRDKNANKSTVFVRNIRSIAGFPIFSEGRLLAILFLGFKNILLDLSDEMESYLTFACDLAGVVIGRAELRNEIVQLRLSNSFIDTNAVPQGRLMVGYSKGLEHVYALIGKFAPVDVPVLITGETGTGKELAARELHRLSLRRNKSFVAFNAAALPENLLEAELFGYKRGAFTGALSDRVGLIEQAHLGTLFIDEIGDLPVTLQAKILRVLQERELVRIGENTPRKVDFRLLSATHFNLSKLVEEKKFRQDLFFRIATAEIQLPPLRERDQDLLLIANYIKQQFCKRQGLRNKEWHKDSLVALRNYSWPGNIRELENLVIRSLIMSESDKIAVQDLGLGGQGQETSTPSNGDGLVSLAQAKEKWLKNYLVDALRRNSGNRSETARSLQIGQRTLFRYLEQYSIKEFGDERH